MAKSVFHVEGMSCIHCENAVKQAVSALAGIHAVTVDLAEKTVTVEWTEEHSESLIRKAIEEQGYEVQHYCDQSQ